MNIFEHVSAKVVFVSPDTQWGFAEYVDVETGDKRTWMCHRRGRREAFVTDQGTITYPDAKIAYGAFMMVGDHVVVMYEKPPAKEGQYPQAIWAVSEQYNPLIEVAAQKRGEYSDHLRKRAAASSLERTAADMRGQLNAMVVSESEVIGRTIWPMSKMLVVAAGAKFAQAAGPMGAMIELPGDRQYLVYLRPNGIGISSSPAATAIFPGVNDEIALVRPPIVSIDTSGEEPRIVVKATGWLSIAQMTKVVASTSKAAATLAENAVKAEEEKRRQQAAIARSHIKGPKLSAPPKGGMAKALARGR